MSKVSEELFQEAVKLNLCEQWQNEWGSPDEDSLIEKYIRGIDFCIKHEFPSNEYILKNFHKENLDKHHLYVDCEADIENPDTAIYQGGSKGNINYNGYAVGTVMIRHNSKVTITASDRSIVAVKVYDNAEVNVVNRNTASKIYVYKYGGKVKTEGNVTVRDKSERVLHF